MLDMDLHIGDLHSAIVGEYSFLSHILLKVNSLYIDREIEIVQVLQEKVLVHDKAMGNACDVCAELDCLISFASASRSYDFKRPLLTEENVIDIKQGRWASTNPARHHDRLEHIDRHPLQELVVDTFVPNDAFMLGGAGIGVDVEEEPADDSSNSDERPHVKNSIIVCTGANACGKASLGVLWLRPAR